MSDKVYWQSIEVPPTEAATAQASGEGLVSLAGLDRRHMLKVMGFSLAAAGCSRAPVRHSVPHVEQPEEAVAGETLYYATTCRGCAASCGILAKARDGRPIKIEGQPWGGSQGGTCAVGQAMVLSVYDEGRLGGPLWQGKESSWEDIDRRMGDRLRAMASRGLPIVLLTAADLGPNARRLIAEWRQRFPSTRHLAYEPISTAAIRQAALECFGRAILPRPILSAARVLVGIEADFLGTWLSPVEQTRAYAERRRPDREMSWHVQLESRMSLTGSNADWRLPVEGGDLGGAVLALYRELAFRAGRIARPPAAEGRPFEGWLEPVADALWQARGEALVLCGLNDPAVQVLVNAINDLLDSFGKTLDLERPLVMLEGSEQGLEQLITDMGQGKIHGLLTWGVNPAYDTPFGEGFAAAMQHVALSACLTDRLDETAAQATAACPVPHPLESWGDQEPVAGERRLSQPAMAPLFATRAAEASLLAWMGQPADARAYLRETWRDEVLPDLDNETAFEAAWAQAVHDGGATSVEVPAAWTPSFAGDTAAAAAEILRSTAAAATQRQAGRLDLLLYEATAQRNGRWANNPWLLELPDPVSKVTWGNYAAIAPALGERLGLADGDVVRLQVEGAAVELPVLLQPGQAVGTVAVALGYGRRRAGKAANGVGTDAYPLVGVGPEGLFRYVRSGITLTPTGRREPLASTQMHHSLEGRPIVQETSLAAFLEDPSAGHAEAHELPSLWPEHEDRQHRWGMTIDLNACTGCSACVIACQAENNVPVVGRDEVQRGREMHWIRIDRYYSGAPEAPETVHQPMFCQHCDHAPCETVCPVLATVHSSDGLNQQVYNRCVGTRYCANNCPYKVRRFNWFNYARNQRFDYHLNSDLGTMVLNPDVVVRSRGVMEKCSMCIQRIQAGKLVARREQRPLADGDIQTACQEVCAADAIVFGDLLSPESAVSANAASPRHYHVLEELGVRPSVGYLTKVRRTDTA